MSELGILSLLLALSCGGDLFLSVRESHDPDLLEPTSETPLQTSCTAVAHLGDSTSTGLVKSYIKDPEGRLDAQYRRVGVQEVRLESFGGRSLAEHRSDHENGVMVAERLRAAGYAGCWVVALGTNDAANINRSETVSGVQARVDRLMAVIGTDPVLWVDAVTQTNRGFYAETSMEQWNRELEVALKPYPNVKIYRWSAEVQAEWFTTDGIHYNTRGLVARAKMIPQALLQAFPIGVK